MEKYSYDTLNLGRPAIRLLILNRGSNDDKIRCSLFQAELQERDNTISYEALSYTWGSQDLTESIIVDGYCLNVTSHLYVALQHLRHQDEDRILWIDAICIDQGNVKERGHQVEQMSKIYKEADRVVFWLGPATLETDVLMESLKLLQRESIKHNYKDWSLQDPFWKHKWAMVERTLKIAYTHFSDLQRDGLQEILSRPWFRRVWILQEVALAKVGIILCGTKSVSTRLFGLVPLLLDIKPDTHCQSVLDIMPSPWRKTLWWSKSPNLRTLLLTFGDSEATESRDLVYALRGISSDAAGNNAIIPDYDKSEEDLVRDVVQFVEHCELEDLALTPPRTIRALIKCLRAHDLDRCMGLAQNSLPHDMEMLLESPEVRINQEIVTTAAARDKTGKVFEIILRYREKDVLVDDEVLVAAAKNLRGAQGVFEALLRYQRGRITISDDVLIAAAKNIQCGDEVLNLLSSSEWDLPKAINEKVLVAAAKNKACGNKAIHALLSLGHTLSLTVEAVIAAAQNEECGDEVLGLILFSKRVRFKGMKEITTEVLIAKNKGCDDKQLGLILSSKRVRFNEMKRITKDVLIAAAKNEGCGDKVLSLILSSNLVRLKGMKGIMKEVLIAAAKNEGCGDKVLSLILSSKRIRLKGIKRIAIDVLQAAMGNKGCGYKVINTLCSHYPNSVTFF
ncbi:uncharacterized protein TrAFT101_009362 [Trichoderma asperellum]|uniref:Heterokaryon incompatibility domain-containing protein n=1 Tax=Trichoderma asperellum (strain ATCC 204424 / CBS 433.97 / NBRC 101777) TaxID=1042311 RepID=A0A2T3YSW8_TRIA4|nr:hypothetical protein M441DRAFT_62651 [Trichoderma asperellum CBS 433.97]PTB35596.1 hypothetical protein M441DRAFT_62651 [Trichoderma asperellum CBS 433.97]UKZ94490.1 hypothetical protein TrAFT101_009362 [Trichoderma asperellum]